MYGHKLRVLIAALLLALGLSGCSVPEAKRTPEQWLSLSYAGLAAMDQYAFSGSMSMGLEEGVMFKPQMFEGKVVNHHQLTIQSDKQDPLYWNPVEVLDSLNRSHESVEIIVSGERDASGADTLVLRAVEKRDAAKKRWTSVLVQELDQVTGEVVIKSGTGSEKRKEIVEQAKQELDAMLRSLEVRTEYEIVVDKQRMLPLKMEEITTFAYERNGRRLKENRHTSVRFQAFESSAARTD
ncbi:hypothetical protein D3P07_00285 [Paenibacillus sp. 1011MAR3C5]|uniref:hypothetical protein n=1 Tax=Paenibacillus sp. 1011MAR3C5 TaxID=1675787 RepID=UPI000E6C0817|nr:hypothetical protein [Paenibacillus sp. 1011MAR3C5]RJE90584.1 hypothetical protein D3P07_00285 [Paenibacillus sp. 1011MAR3C5]